MAQPRPPAGLRGRMAEEAMRDARDAAEGGDYYGSLQDDDDHRDVYGELWGLDR